MSGRLRFSPYLRGSTATAALLALSLLLAGAVAWRARTAARAQRAAVQRLMQDHAGYAAAEFTRRAGERLQSLTSALQTAERRATGPLLAPAELADSVRTRDVGCDCLGPANGFFVLDPRTGRLALAGDSAGPQAARWVREQVDAAARGEHTAVQVRTVDGRAALLAFAVIPEESVGPRAAYGVLDDAGPISARIFQRVWATVPLLPGSVMRGAPNDSLVRVSVAGPDGTELWSSGPPTWSQAAAEEPFPSTVSGLTTRVEILPRAVPWLLRGGLPTSPQPLLLGLMALTTGVVGVAFMQMRRQHALARMRADFVSGVSHELRTPITQIRLFTELLMGGRLRTDQERQHSLQLIERETRRLTFLVERILDFSRSERGALSVHRSVIDAQPILREALDGFEPVARARGMVVRATLEPELIASLDAYAVRHILLNFLENAVKYGPPGQIIWVGAERADGAIRIWVEDGGPGVPPDERTRIWEPYYRLDRPTDRVVGGSGIGLSLVRDLVARHEGRSWVEDGERRGARFIAEFPATWDPEVETADAQPSGSA
jgi:signal transduction histidine kinase